MANRRNPIFVSHVAYAPWSIFAPHLVTSWAKKAGYTGLQILPTHGMISRPVLSLPVRYLENVWYIGNPGNRRTLIDRAFFPDYATSQELYRYLEEDPDTQTIGHEFDSSTRLLEPHHGLWMTADEIYRKAKTEQIGLVLDTWHLREPLTKQQIENRPVGISSPVSLLGDWRESVKTLGPLTKVVHVQTRSVTELRATLANADTELAQLIAHIRDNSDHPDWVGEFSIGLRGLNPFTLIRLHQKMHLWLKLKLTS